MNTRNPKQNPSGVVGIGLVDKQNGGNGQFARVEVTVQSLPASDSPNEIRNAVVGATIPTDYIRNVVAGIMEGLQNGPLGGYPVTGVLVSITGGKAHAVDSSAQAFQEAGRLAVKDALSNATPALLEPMALLDVTTPAEFVGAVIGDLNRRRGQILEMTARADGSHFLHARVPLAETFGYSTDLRSLTQGRAGFVLEPQGYAEAPHLV